MCCMNYYYESVIYKIIVINSIQLKQFMYSSSHHNQYIVLITLVLCLQRCEQQHNGTSYNGIRL